jgi:hypothetical protein
MHQWFDALYWKLALAAMLLGGVVIPLSSNWNAHGGVSPNTYVWSGVVFLDGHIWSGLLASMFLALAHSVLPLGSAIWGG